MTSEPDHDARKIDWQYITYDGWMPTPYVNEGETRLVFTLAFDTDAARDAHLALADRQPPRDATRPDVERALRNGDPGVVGRLARYILTLEARLAKSEASNEMACIEADPECDCSGCETARTTQGEGHGDDD